MFIPLFSSINECLSPICALNMNLQVFSEWNVDPASLYFISVDVRWSVHQCSSFGFLSLPENTDRHLLMLTHVLVMLTPSPSPSFDFVLTTRRVCCPAIVWLSWWVIRANQDPRKSTVRCLGEVPLPSVLGIKSCASVVLGVQTTRVPHLQALGKHSDSLEKWLPREVSFGVLP